MIWFILGICIGGTLGCTIAALLNIIGEEEDGDDET